MSTTTSELNKVDLVIPYYNEERELPLLFNNLGMQVDADGHPLKRESWRLILVDNGSEDGSAQVVEAWLRNNLNLEVVVLHEPIKSHIQARISGVTFALKQDGKSRYPILANADADTRFHPQWIDDISKRLSTDNFDVLSYAGYFPTAFWSKVPALTQGYFDNLGTIFFSRQTIEEFGYSGRESLFTERVFLDFGRMPSDCGFALTKRLYEVAGGYRRDYWPDGREVLGEGWNLKFRLDSVGARNIYVSDKPYQTSPRRLLLEADDLLSGKSYTGEMSDLRDAPQDHNFRALNALASTYDFDPLRRYVVKNYILLHCITRPQLILKNSEYFGAARNRLMDDIAAARLQLMTESSARVYALAEVLLRCYYDDILLNVSRMQTIV